jgi:hypothetical protein
VIATLTRATRQPPGLPTLLCGYSPWRCSQVCSCSAVRPSPRRHRPNDDITDATVFTTLPFSDGPLDTTVATTALDDPDCVGNGPAVWYVFTPAAGGFVLVNTFGSDYDTTLSVYTGEPGALTQITCNDDFNGLQSLVNCEAIADTPYYILSTFPH